MFEDLKLQFPTRTISIYGNVVVVPEKKFELDWDHELSREGCVLTRLEVDDVPSVLVSPPRPVVSKEEPKRKYKPRVGSWTPEQIELLLKEYPKQKGTNRACGEALEHLFPGHSAMSIYPQYWKLTRTPKHEEVPPSLKKQLKERAIEHAEESETKVPEPEKESLTTTLLKEIRDLLKPETFIFDYACPICGEVGNVSATEKIWRFCPVCGKPLIVWNVS